MVNEVKVTIDAKINYIDEYFDIPESLQSTVEEFKEGIIALGETCQSAAELEEKFNGSELYQKYIAIMTGGKQKTHKMTKEEKKNSANIFKDMATQNKGEYITSSIKDSVEKHVTADLSEKITTKNREQMIEDGTFDDYSRTTGMISGIEFFGKKLFGGKKKKRGEGDEEK